MKIALPHEYGYVNQHFGKSREFVIVEIEGRQIVAKKIISAEQLQHNHEGLDGLLRDEQVDTVIVGGIGAGALQPLKANGLQVVTEISGKIDDVVVKYTLGQLHSNSAASCDNHDANCEH